MKQPPAQAPDRARRSFLLAASGAGALAALAARGGAAQAMPQPVAAPPAPATSGYHETEHIRKYYSSARYW